MDSIFNPPEQGFLKSSVNVVQLIVQWIGILLVTGLSFLYIKSTPSDQISSMEKHQKEITQKVETEYNGIAPITYDIDKERNNIKIQWSWRTFVFALPMAVVINVAD